MAPPLPPGAPREPAGAREGAPPLPPGEAPPLPPGRPPSAPSAAGPASGRQPEGSLPAPYGDLEAAVLREQVRDLENRLKVTTADRDAAQVTLQRRLGGAAKGRPELLALVGAQQKDLEAASQSLAQLRERVGAAATARAGEGDGDDEVEFLVSEMDALSKSYAAAQAQNGRLDRKSVV